MLKSKNEKTYFSNSINVLKSIFLKFLHYLFFQEDFIVYEEVKDGKSFEQGRAISSLFFYILVE